jgi:hypothetical protein
MPMAFKLCRSAAVNANEMTTRASAFRRAGNVAKKRARSSVVRMR